MSSKRLLIIGAALGVITVVLLNVYLGQVRSSQQQVALLRLAPGVSLAKGGAVTEDMLVTEYLPEQFGSITKLAVADSHATRAWVVNRRVNKDVESGAFLLHEYFVDQPEERFTVKIQKSMRAITIPVDATAAVSYLVDPSSRVDVLGTFEEPPSGSRSPPAPAVVGRSGSQADVQRAIAAQAQAQLYASEKVVRTHTILQNVRVLAVGRATTRGNYLGVQEGGFSTVTLEVTPSQAEVLTFALSQARRGLSLVLRNPSDDEMVDVESVSWASLRQKD
ncbi:MAG: Flp pilus assembly protein CpaB [Deltaproteobacteria bacterium]|nr:Flp pilus assembly protein CpaB [Deltaproteobacteria bacterium]